MTTNRLLQPRDIWDILSLNILRDILVVNPWIRVQSRFESLFVGNVDVGHSRCVYSARSRFDDRRVEPYNRGGRRTMNARRKQPLRGQLVPVTHYLDRVHNELVKQLGDKYLSLLDGFRREHPV